MLSTLKCSPACQDLALRPTWAAGGGQVELSRARVYSSAVDARHGFRRGGDVSTAPFSWGVSLRVLELHGLTGRWGRRCQADPSWAIQGRCWCASAVSKLWRACGLLVQSGARANAVGRRGRRTPCAAPSAFGRSPTPSKICLFPPKDFPQPIFNVFSEKAHLVPDHTGSTLPIYG